MWAIQIIILNVRKITKMMILVKRIIFFKLKRI